MDLDTHIEALEKSNRKLFSSQHFLLLCIAIVVIFGVLAVAVDPVFAVTISGFVAFFCHFLYVQYAFKQQSARISLLQTKLKQSLAKKD